MALLIEYLEEAAAYLREKKEKLKKLDVQYRHIYDRDIKKEMAQTRLEIAKKSSEVTNELLYNLEEFRSIHKYYPELLKAYLEDEYIGKVILKKAWLLDFKTLPAKAAAEKLQELKTWRAQLKDAKKFLKGWVGTVSARSFIATYPVLRGYLSGDIDKVDVVSAIKRADKILLREGWLLLISDSLIQIPIAKFMTQINSLLYEEMTAKAAYARSQGRGTVAETVALRKYQEITKKRLHYEKVLTQVLLANPNYLKILKKKKSWLSREKAGNLDKIVQSITPHTIKERVWLNQMRKKLEEK
ncbi:MAG: hypothetical protein V1861_00520 [Candidatus Micrarchaeota archaeon]